MTTSCFCFSTSGSLSNPPQEKAVQMMREITLIISESFGSDLVIENKAYLLQRKKIPVPQVKPLTS